ncbi:hypothetical protein C8J57DRAFT_1605944 [Mycena rebaudengoi]|nr:hypothetical protein C8J57DRAFT_1605944 [Mycena rebaudengoi]
MSEAIREVGLIYAPFLGGMMVGCLRLYIFETSGTIQSSSAHWILDTFHFVMVSEGLHNWYIFCKLPQNYALLTEFRWSLGASMVATYCITTLVQMLYILRVYRLGKKMWIALVLGALSLAQLAFGLREAILVQIYPSTNCYLVLWEDLLTTNTLLSLHKPTGQIAGSGTLVATALCDIGISLGLWFYLHRGRTGFAKTEKMIDKLILYMVNLGLLTSVASLLTLILFLVMPHSFAFVALTIIRSRLYSNALLAALNYRDAVRTALHGDMTHTSNFFQEVELDGMRSYNKGNVTLVLSPSLSATPATKFPLEKFE